MNKVIAYRSCAEWPAGHFHFADRPNITTDRHATKKQAEGVCEMLETQGLGGEFIHFPVRTWVEEIFEGNERWN